MSEKTSMSEHGAPGRGNGRPRPRPRRVLVIERGGGQSAAAVAADPARAASTAQAARRARAALRALGAQPVSLTDLDPAGYGAFDARMDQACCPRPSWSELGHGVDFVLVLGGDGTILRASDIARDLDVPLVGVNTGHVGFLAEAAPEAVEQVVADVVAGHYTVDERMTLDVEVIRPSGQVCRSWALNEAALDKRERARMMEVAIGVDGQAVSSFGCDGLVTATPTGSTAYAFSGGGPVVWPEVEALLLVPLAAHALFTRPMVLSPASCLEVVVRDSGRAGAELWCDGWRHLAVPTGSRIRVTRSARPVRLARLSQAPFATRLVGKFDLPVEGWRTLSGREEPSSPGGDGRD